jgi:hypothetical protein
MEKDKTVFTWKSISVIFGLNSVQPAAAQSRTTVQQ